MRMYSPILLTLMLLAPIAMVNAQDIDKINGGIDVQAGQTRGDLATVNGAIRIGDNATAKKAETVNGDIHVGKNARVRDLSTVNGAIRIEAGTHAGDVETVNGSIFLDRGSRAESLETVNGSIGLVDAELSEDISTVAGDVTVGIGSHVRGGLKMEKDNGIGLLSKISRIPRIVIGPRAVVEGAMLFERPVTLYVHRSARTGPVQGAKAIVFNTPQPPSQP